MKKNFLRFFERRALKQNLLYFKRWRSKCEFFRHRAQEYQQVRKFLQTRESYYQGLADEKQRQLSRDLLNGFQSLNMNKLKAEEEADSNVEETT